MSNSIEINGSRRLGAVLMVFIVGMSVLAGGVTAAPSDELSYDGETTAPNPYFDVDGLTVDSHPMEKGTSAADMAGYYDDNGDWKSNTEFVVNTSSDAESGTNVNPYTFQPAYIDESSYGLFPRVGDSDNQASALDAGEWTKSGANSSKLTVSNTEIAQNAPAVNIATDGTMASGDTATASYSNWTTELDSDESKRVLQIAGQVNSIDSGATVNITLTDESGDTKKVQIKPGSSQDVKNNTVAGSTGTFVFQKKLSSISTVGGGSWNNIESIDVTVTDADADVTFSWVDAENKGMATLGQQTVDADGDGTYDEKQTVTSTTGSLSVNSMDTLDSKYNDATVNDVTFPAQFRAQDLQGSEGEEAAYIASFEKAENYPSFDEMLKVRYRMQLPGAIDLSYSGVELVIEQQFPSDRYVSFGVAEGVSSSTNLSDASLSDSTGSFGEVGKNVVLDSTVQVGTGYVVGGEVKVTQENKKAMMATSGASAPPQSGGSSGGIFGFISSIPGMLVTAAGGILGIKWLKG